MRIAFLVPAPLSATSGGYIYDRRLIAGLEAALGARSGARYVQRMLEEAQRQGGALRTAKMRQFIDEAEPGDLDSSAKHKAHRRVDVLEDIEASPQDAVSDPRPGRAPQTQTAAPGGP